MNSMAADVTMFTDDSVRCDGPIVSGPSMWDWAQDLREGRLPGEDVADLGSELAAELRALTAATFPSRRLQSAYLGWVLRHVIADLPAAVRVHVHECRATGLTDDGAAQLVHLNGGATLRVDAVVLASGHLDATPTDAELDLAARAAAAGLRYLPPEQTTDSDLSSIQPGEPVIVRGTGLAFVDLVVLLFEGRGGRYEPGPDGELRLRALRTGAGTARRVAARLVVPREDRVRAARRPPRCPVPRPGERQPAGRARRCGPAYRGVAADGQGDRLGLVPRAAARPPRPRPAGRRHLHRPVLAAAWGSPEMAALLDEAVPDRRDRLDFRRSGPPAGRRRRRLAGRLQPLVRAHIRTTCASTSTPRTPRTSARSWRCCRSTRRSRRWSPRAR